MLVKKNDLTSWCHIKVKLEHDYITAATTKESNEP